MNTPSQTCLIGRPWLLAATFLACCVSAVAQTYNNYDLVIATGAFTDAETVIDGAGRIMPANRSYVIGIEAGSHGRLNFRNWVGSPAYPVIIANKDGKAVISDALGSVGDAVTLSNCTYVQIRGDNAAVARYGIEIARAGEPGGAGWRDLIVTGASSFVEVAFVEAHHATFAGIMVKSDPSCNTPETSLTNHNWGNSEPLPAAPINFVMQGINIHDCYVHDTGGEGMYLGYSSWAKQVLCDSANTNHPKASVRGHELQHLRVNHNLVERSGWDGIQVSSATLDIKVHDNIVYQAATLMDTNQGNSLFVGGGSTGEYYNNLLLDTNLGSMNVIAPSRDVSVYNNVMHGGGVFARAGPVPYPTSITPGSWVDYLRTQPGGFVNFFNNTMVYSTTFGFRTDDQISANRFKNNIVVAADTAYPLIDAQNGAVLDQDKNVAQRDSLGINFVNEDELDFRVASGSNAINAGMSLAGLPSPQVSVIDDITGVTRPQGGTYDAGASEYGGLSVYLVATPPTTGNTGSVKASVIGGTPPYSYSWSNSGTTQTISSVPEGFYTVLVTDAAGVKVRKGIVLRDGAGFGAPASDVLGANQVLAPTFSPAPGSYSTYQTVSLSSATSGASIRYTTDASEPTSTYGIAYAGAFTVADSTSIRAVAYKSGMTTSQLRVGQYAISIPGPTNSKFSVVNADITESSHQGSANTKDKTIDGDLTTGWQSVNLGDWIRYDLGSSRRVSSVKIGFPQQAATPEVMVRHNRFVVQGSTDDVNYFDILGTASNPHTNWTGADSLGLQEYDFPDVDNVRYIRIVGYGYITTSKTNVVVLNNFYREVEIWGGSAGSGNPIGTYQAENAAMSGAVVRSNQPGYTGTGFADYINNSGDYVEWTITNPTAATRGLTWRFASTSARTLSLSINGVVVNSALTFPSTTSITAWLDKAVTATLPAGTVTIRLTATGTSGPNIDYLEIN